MYGTQGVHLHYAICESVIVIEVHLNCQQTSIHLDYNAFFLIISFVSLHLYFTPSIHPYLSGFCINMHSTHENFPSLGSIAKCLEQFENLHCNDIIKINMCLLKVCGRMPTETSKKNNCIFRLSHIRT